MVLEDVLLAVVVSWVLAMLWVSDLKEIKDINIDS